MRKYKLPHDVHVRHIGLVELKHFDQNRIKPNKIQTFNLN